MGADHAAARADVGEHLEPLAHVLPAPGERREGVELRQVAEHALDLLVDVRGQQRERLHAGLLGHERRVLRVRAEHAVHLARDLPERVQLVEHHARAAGELVEHELPAVARAGQVLLEDPERRVDLAALDLVPAGERGDVRELARGQEAQQLELRVDARLDAPERLEDQLLAEHHRRVRLLDADRPDLDRPRHARRRGLRPAEAQQAVLDRDVVALADPVQQLAALRGVGERVVDRPPVGLRDHALLPAVLGRPQPERDLVGLVRPLAEARLDQHEHEQRRLGAQRDDLGEVDLTDLARLRAEPALGDDPLLEDVGVEDREVGDVSHPRPPRAGTSRSRAARA